MQWIGLTTRHVAQPFIHARQIHGAPDFDWPSWTQAIQGMILICDPAVTG